jgi:3,4-dihydroxy 2-butanone 4-phosphate synthase/GTP cyclohydrolase II
VLVRAGHTEAASDLARLAGLEPAGVLVEILNADGSMARRPEYSKGVAHQCMRVKLA